MLSFDDGFGQRDFARTLVLVALLFLSGRAYWRTACLVSQGREDRTTRFGLVLVGVWLGFLIPLLGSGVVWYPNRDYFNEYFSIFAVAAGVLGGITGLYMALGVGKAPQESPSRR